MKIYWVLFSSCLTTSGEASWILNSAGDSAHLLFLKVSTVWNARISVLEITLPHTERGFLLHFPPCLGARSTLPHIISVTQVGPAASLPLPAFEPCWCKSLMGGTAGFKWALLCRCDLARKQVGQTPRLPFYQLPCQSVLILTSIWEEQRGRKGEKNIWNPHALFCAFPLKFASTVYHYSPCSHCMLHSVRHRELSKRDSVPARKEFPLSTWEVMVMVMMIMADLRCWLGVRACTRCVTLCSKHFTNSNIFNSYHDLWDTIIVKAFIEYSL